MSHGVWPGLVLLTWVPISLLLFVRISAPKATVWCIVGAHLFLPELAAYDFPLVPAINKDSLSASLALFLLVVFHPRRVAQGGPYSWVLALMGLLAVSFVGTALTNRDPPSYGTWRVTYLPGLTLKDGISQFLAGLFTFGIPFLVGRMAFRDSKDMREGMRQVVLLGLLYVPFLLWEIRMSPNLHKNLYGYPPHIDFSQTLRWGGYRPQAFTRHGLIASRFMLGVLIFAVALHKANVRIWALPGRWTTWGLAVFLVLCKSTAAIGYALGSLLLFRFLSTKNILRVTLAFGLIAVTYPYTRAAGLFPSDGLVSVAESISKDRADSLAFRFYHENELLEKAQQRLLLGWGGYGRMMVYHPQSGKNLSVTDGSWIIWLGEGGLVGMLVPFSLLVLPLYWIWRAEPQIKDRKTRILLTGLAMYVSLNAVEQLPNSSASNLEMFFAGMLAALAKGLPIERRRPHGFAAPAAYPGVFVGYASPAPPPPAPPFWPGPAYGGEPGRSGPN